MFLDALHHSNVYGLHKSSIFYFKDFANTKWSPILNRLKRKVYEMRKVFERKSFTFYVSYLSSPSRGNPTELGDPIWLGIYLSKILLNLWKYGLSRAHPSPHEHAQGYQHRALKMNLKLMKSKFWNGKALKASKIKFFNITLHCMKNK